MRFNLNGKNVLTKNSLNLISIIVALWTGATTLLFMWRHDAFASASYGSPIAWAFLIAMFFIPFLIPFVNGRGDAKSSPSLFVGILQLAFMATWIMIGLVFVFANGNPSLLNNLVALALLLIVAILFSGLGRKSSK